MDQVRNVSLDVFDPRAARRIDDATWCKAVAFETLFDTGTIARVDVDGSTFYCCLPRDNPKYVDVRIRKAMPAARARESCTAFFAQRRGDPTTPEKLALFAGPDACRVFGVEAGVCGMEAFCTCPSYPSHKVCFHTIGLQIHTGALTAPPRLNNI